MKQPKPKKSNGIDEFAYRPYVAPVMSPGRRVDIEHAAHLHAEANRSDPFSRGRATLHMRRGLELASDIKADAERLLHAGGNHAKPDAAE